MSSGYQHMSSIIMSLDPLNADGFVSRRLLQQYEIVAVVLASEHQMASYLPLNHYQHYWTSVRSLKGSFQL